MMHFVLCIVCDYRIVVVAPLNYKTMTDVMSSLKLFHAWLHIIKTSKIKICWLVLSQLNILSIGRLASLSLDDNISIPFCKQIIFLIKDTRESHTFYNSELANKL